MSLPGPGAAIMTLAYGWMFGLASPSYWSVFRRWLARTAVAFLTSRYLLRDVIQQRFGRQLAGFNSAFDRDGAFYSFTLRLIPAVPFFVINAGMGLTRSRFEPIGGSVNWECFRQQFMSMPERRYRALTS